MALALPLLFGGMFIGFACEPGLDPREQPTAEEMAIAANFVDVKTYPATYIAMQLECLDERGRAAGLYYTDYSILMLMDGWRNEGGLTVLVHEMYHHKQATEGLRMSECDAADAGARYAYQYGEWDRWPSEVVYGLRHCVGGQEYRYMYVEVADGFGFDEVDPDESEFPQIERSMHKVFPELKDAPYEWRPTYLYSADGVLSV